MGRNSVNGERKITELRGIGKSRADAFARVGVETFDDMVSYYPRAYQNRGNTMTVSEIKTAIDEGKNGPFSSVLTVAAEPKVRMIRRGMTLTKLRVFDETGVCEITYFNQNFLKDVFHTGAAFRFWGKFVFEHGKLAVSSPLYEPYVEGRELPPIVPVYPLTTGLTQKIVAAAAAEAMRLVLPERTEYLPHEVLAGASLPTSSYAIKNIHMPESVEALEAAKRRLIFDEIFLTSIALASSGVKKRIASSSEMCDGDANEFLELLPYRLTGAQSRALEEIISDMTGKYAMNRILTGDVGSGKTVVAAASAYISMKNGYDVLFMVPTEILANQHYKDLEPLFSQLGYNVFLLTGSVTKAERRIVTASLEGFAPTLVIGTHALLSDDIRPASLGLIIIDEQHRFGAMQRAALVEKCEGVNTLAMSATPIPRTLSMVIYGNLDVSRIDELPAGRQPVDTFIVNEGYRARLNGFIKKQVDEGRQVYVVCPSIEENTEKKEKSDSLEEAADILLFAADAPEELPLKAARKYAEELSDLLVGVNVGFVHGKMKSAEREEIMKRFCSGELDVLVSTTVIEVGVNVPNATLMVVENAERFGLSQLHQLRGRVGRGNAKSYFILVTDSTAERSRERLATLKNNRNGYAIAEADLKQRGPGDFFAEGGAVRQHGRSPLTMASGCTDTELIALAVGMAERVLSADPELSMQEHSAIRERIGGLVRRNENLLN